MSRRRNTERTTEAVCTWCQLVPTRDAAFVCDPCLTRFARGLRDLLPTGDDVGLWVELLNTVVGERAIDYSVLGGSGGSVWLIDEDDLKPGERPMVVATGISLNELASDTRECLVAWLRVLVRLCQMYRLDHQAPPEWKTRFTRPDEVVPAMAEWLGWRVDAMTWHLEIADTARRVFQFIEWARWCIDRPAARQQLGPCKVPGCDGDLSAVVDATFASCYRCGAQVEAQPLRDRLLDELDDRLCTADEIARLTTYLGLPSGRTQIANRIRQWGHRGVIAKRDPDPDTGAPRYRFGDAKQLLLQHDAEKNTDTSKGA